MPLSSLSLFLFQKTFYFFFTRRSHPPVLVETVETRGHEPRAAGHRLHARGPSTVAPWHRGTVHGTVATAPFGAARRSEMAGFRDVLRPNPNRNLCPDVFAYTV